MHDIAFPPVPAIPRETLFKIGVTSYVYPADILPNVLALAGKIQDIELVLFESPDFSNFPDPDLIRRLSGISREHGFTYTVHFPIDRKLGSSDSEQRRLCLEQILRTIELTQPLAPHAFILHAEGIEPDASPDDVQRWQESILPSLNRIVSGVERPDLLCLENLGYPFEWCAPFLDAHPIGICLDIGHLWLRGDNVQAHIDKYLARTRVIHLYGITPDSTAHISLAVMPEANVREVVQAFHSFKGVLTLETFGYDDTCSSIERLKECL